MTSELETLNCPNCGAAVSSDRPQCEFCKSRLKTMACPSCLGLMFVGAQYCGRCGELMTAIQAVTTENAGDCPRCKVRLDLINAGEALLRECHRCGGMWADADTFGSICTKAEMRSAVLGYIGERRMDREPQTVIRYVPCPDCGELMNRNNFAKVSGVILDICKEHGVWFDADELPSIIEFIRKGGLDAARQREKASLDAERQRLRDESRQQARNDRRFASHSGRDDASEWEILSFVKGIFERL